MMTSVAKNQISLLLIIASIMLGCSSKKEEKKGKPSGSVVLQQPGPTNTILQTIKMDTAQPAVSGLPNHPSKSSSTTLQISGSDWKHYKYVFIQGTDSCETKTYGDWQLLSKKISLSFATDGPKRICFLFSGGDEENPKLTFHEHYWERDTKAPSGSIDSLEGFGPNFFDGASVTFTGSASDDSEELNVVKLSISDGTKCLNSGKTSFNANCPNYLSTEGSTTWSMSISKDRFINDRTYTPQLYVTDKAGNEKIVTGSASKWDNVSPAAIGTFTVTGQPESMDLSWDSVTGAAYYLVVRKEATEVSITPDPSLDFSDGLFLGEDNVVSYFGTGLNTTDTNLKPNTLYHYAAYALDSSRNISSEITGNGISSELPRFPGINEAYVAGKGRSIIAKWNAFHDGIEAHSSITYQIYVADTSGGHDFSATPTATVQGEDKIVFTAPGTSETVYVVVKDMYTNGDIGANSREVVVELKSDHQYYLTNTRRYDDIKPEHITMYVPRAGHYDKWDNYLFSSEDRTINVLCMENTSAPYCKNKNINKIYHLAGKLEAVGDGGNDEFAFNSLLGEIWGIATDDAGNVFLADYDHRRIRAICYEPDQPGFCFGKTAGQIYHAAGTGQSGDGLDDENALYQRMANPTDVAVDSDGNIYIVDNAYERIRVVCWETTSVICNGKTKGYIYHLAGTGAAADGGDGPKHTTQFGVLYGIDVDSKKNVYVADYSYRKVRAVCNDVSTGAGFCEGKTVDNIYTLIGTGTNGDSGDDVAAAGQAMGRPYGIALDPNSNIWISDYEQRRIRTICQDVVSAGYCSSKTSGNVYQYAFTGASGDGADGDDATSTATAGGLYKLDLDSLGNVTVVDYTYQRLRTICQDVASGGYCDGKTASSHYRHAGSYNIKTGIDEGAGLGGRMGDVAGTAIDSKGNIYTANIYDDVINVYCLDTSGTTGPCVGKQTGHIYYVAGTGTAGNAADDVAALSAAINNPYGVTLDSSDNLYFVDYTNRYVRVVCYDTSSSANFCNGKTSGNMYQFAGDGSNTDGADDSPALTTSLGQPYSLEFDNYDNLMVTDNSRRRLRAICVDVTSPGFCNGKHDPISDGNYHHYRFAGTGSSSDGDTGPAGSTALGTLAAVAVDSLNNIYVSDYQFERVRVICQEVSSGGFCDGKTAGDIYRYTGTGSIGDGGDDEVATSSAIRDIYGLALDGGDNLYLSGGTYERVRLICQDTSFGKCQGRTVGNTYHLYGIGTNADGAYGSDATTERFGAVSIDGLVIQNDGTVIYADAQYDVLRVFLP